MINLIVLIACWAIAVFGLFNLSPYRDLMWSNFTICFLIGCINIPFIINRYF